LDELRAQKEELEADLAGRTAASPRGPQDRHPGPEALAAALPDGAALIDLYEYAHFTPPEGGKGKFRGERRLLAFVVRRGRPVALVRLGAARPVDDAVAAWRRALAAGRTDALDAAAADLGRRVWGPLRAHLDGVSTALVAPDGALASFPFAALPGGRPGS